MPRWKLYCAAPARAERTSSSTGGSSMSASKHRQKAYPAIKIRLATLDDVEGITDLAMHLLRSSPTYNVIFPCDPEATRKHLTLAIRSQYMAYIVAVDGDRVVGNISYSFDDR